MDEAFIDTFRLGGRGVSLFFIILRKLNIDFIEMFPRVIDVHIKGDKGDSITALLQEYADIYETEDAQKDVNIIFNLKICLLNCSI